MDDKPDTQTTTAAVPMQTREALLVPATVRETDAGTTVEVTWTTGARRRAYSWARDEVIDEELAVDASSVDMTRFDAGTVQVLDSHRTYGGLNAILGIAERAWIEGGEGRALLRLSQREELAGIVADIKAGIIRSISFGYSVQRYEVTEARARTDGANVPLYRATRWTPHEISFVTVPADPQAQTRSHSPADAAPCEFIRAAVAAAPITSQRTMDENQQAAPAPVVAAPAVTAPSAADTRAADIIELCTRHAVPQLAATMVREGKSVDEARAAILNELAVRDAAAGGHMNVRVETVSDETETRVRGMEEALLHRVDSRAKLTDAGRQFRGMSLLEIGRDMLESRGVKTRGMDRLALATQMLQHRSGGFHTSSDFSSILANVAAKRLRAGYEENPGTYTRWARRAPNAPDFKNVTIVQLSAMPELLKVNEHGEFKYGTASDGQETYAVTTYGRIVSLSRQAIVNDDLRAFDRLVAGFGASASRLENRTVYAQLTDNPNMADGQPLFAAARGNNATGAGSVLSLASLTEARRAMRVQRGLAGELLNLGLATVIVPAALEQLVYQLTSANYVPATPANVNEFRSGGRTAVDSVVEPLLDGISPTTWYGAAGASQIDTVEYCYLDGAEGPVIESEMGFEVDGVSFKCRLDFAAKALDFRGLYRAVGA